MKDPYGMQTLDEVLTALEGCSWFSTLDLVDGFFSLPLYPADRAFTAFHTPLGLFKWNVLPQGTSASPAIFQRMMDKWFAAFIWKSVIVWIDDILVYSKDFDSHLVALREVFLVLRKYGLVASRKKLRVCMRSVRYLGYIFGVQGIRADPDKLAAVHKIPTPSGRKQVRQFLGFANFYRRFMPPNFSSIIAPLTALTSEKQPFAWTSECAKAFDRVKLLLTSTPVLVHPDFTKPFHIHCDASGKGIGAVLSQYVDGAYRPIAFCSRKLLPHQMHWSPAQLEAYAVYYSVVEKWRYYLALSKTVIHSDHRNLIWLLEHQHKGMIGRWYSALTAFDLDISYVSGSSQLVADPLSRLFKEVKDGTYQPGSNPRGMLMSANTARLLSLMAHVPFHGSLDQPPPWTGRRLSLRAGMAVFPAAVKGPEDMKTMKQWMESQFTGSQLCLNLPRSVWAESQREDAYLGPIYDFLSSESTADPKAHPKNVRTRAQSFRLVNGILMYRSIREVGQVSLEEGWVVAVPQTLEGKVIDTFHGDNASGHGGVRKTTLAIRQRFHFKNMRAKVVKALRKCVACRRAKLRIAELDSPLSPMVSSSPFSAISIDIYAPGSVTSDGFKYVLTVVDLCTKWTAFFPLKTKMPAEVLATLCTQWFHVHGLPAFILSDRGKEFLGVVSTVCSVIGVKQIKTTPYHKWFMRVSTQSVDVRTPDPVRSPFNS